MTTKKRKIKHYQLIFCLSVSVFIWFAVKMSKNYTQTYQFDIEFVNIPQTKLLSYQSDTIVVVTLNGKGVSLLKYEFGRKKVKVDYAIISTAEQRQNNRIIIKNNQLNRYFIQQLDFNEDAIINSPSQIVLELEMAM